MDFKIRSARGIFKELLEETVIPEVIPDEEADTGVFFKSTKK